MSTIAHMGGVRVPGPRGVRVHGLPIWASLRLRPGVALAFLCVAALGVRLALALGHEGYWGVDGGAYLLSRNAVLGLGPAGLDFPRPPLAPGWLLVPFTWAFGDNKGYELFSAMGSMIFVVPFYLLCRRILSPWWAVFATAFLLVDLLHAEMFVTGVLPMIAFGWLLFAIWGLMGWLGERGRWYHVAAIVAGLPMIAYTNQTAAGITAGILLPIAVILWLSRLGSLSRGKRLRGPALRSLFPLILGGLLALTALPWYLGVAIGSDLTRFPGPLVYSEALYTGLWQALIVIPVAVLALWKGCAQVRALGLGLLLLGVLMPWFSNDEAVMNIFYRSRYLAPLFFYPLAAWGVSRLIPKLPKHVLRQGIAGAAAFALMAGLWLVQVQNQGQYSDMVTPDVEAALAEIPAGSTVVTNSFMLSLWAGVLTDSNSLWLFTTEPPAKWQETDQQVRCLLGWVHGCNAEAATALGVTHVVVDYRHQQRPGERSRPLYGAPGGPDVAWAATDTTPWMTRVFERGTVIAWEVT